MVGSWVFVKMLCADGGGLTVSCCPGLLLSVVTTFIHTCVVKGTGKVSRSCAEGLRTAEISYVLGRH